MPEQQASLCRHRIAPVQLLQSTFELQMNQPYIRALHMYGPPWDQGDVNNYTYMVYVTVDKGLVCSAAQILLQYTLYIHIGHTILFQTI